MRLFALGTRVSLALVLLSTLAPAEAQAPALSIGAVNASVPAGEFAPVLKQALREELAQAELPSKRGRAFVLDATLVKLTAEKDDSVRATAVVSVVLRRARDSSLHAMLSGRATAEESASVEVTRDTALRAAVRSALRGLPQAVAAE